MPIITDPDDPVIDSDLAAGWVHVTHHPDCPALSHPLASAPLN
jgi:hypothetical protein